MYVFFLQIPLFFPVKQARPALRVFDVWARYLIEGKVGEGGWADVATQWPECRSGRHIK